MAIEKKKYIDSAALQYLLGKLRDKNKELFLGKMAEAASAAKVKNALTLTVGENTKTFDGSAAISAEVAAKVHKHTHADITDFDAAVKKAAFGDESASMKAHAHSNKATLDKLSDAMLDTWNAKISVDDVDKIKYENAGMTSVKDVKGALDVLVANVRIAAGQLTETSKNMEVFKKIADDAATAAAAEKTRAQNAEKGLADRLDVVEGEGEGSIKKALADAKTYANGKDAAIQAAKAAADAAQADVDALEEKVGTVDEGKTVVGLIADAKKAGTDAAAAVATEKGRAEGVEQGLRDDLGQASDPAAAEGSAFARIAQVKADLGAEAATARAAEQANATAAKAAQDDVDALEAKVGVVPADKTVVQMIAEAQTNATYDDTALKNRVATIEGDYLKAADKTELQGNIDTVSGVANAAKNKIDAFMLAADVKEGAVDTLKEIQDYITSDGTAAQKMTQDIAANAQAIKAEADRAKAAEKANADDIAVLKGADTVEGSVAKAVKDAKDAVMTEVNKKVAQSDYNTKIAELEQADTTNLAAAKKYADDEDAKIEAILGHKAKNDQEATGLCADVAANAAAIAAEATARQDADKLLSDRIAKFESGDNSVAAQVKAVKDDLDAHKKAQATKEKAVDDKLAVIQGEANVEGSIKKALADAKAYTDTKESAINGLLGTKEDAASADTAFGRIKAEAARATAAETALADRATALETKVGDSTKGLVKDVADLKTTVGNAQSGLVKDVADLKTIDAGTRLTTAETSIKDLQAWVAAHETITNAELDAMLNDVYGPQA